MQADKKASQPDECSLFCTYRGPLREDLLANDVPSSVAGALLNYFDPREPDYLDHVDTWQKSLCAGVVCEQPPEFLQAFGVFRKTVYGTWSMLECEPWKVKLIHRVAKLFYKFRGEPRKKTDMGEVKQRFAHPADIALSTHEVEGIRSALQVLVPPDWGDLVGRFGPGVTADGLDNSEKWRRTGFIPKSVPKYLYFCDPIDFIENHRKLQPCRYGVTKVSEVPKSLKSNRIVSSEPAYFMYAQLAVNDALVAELHKRFPAHVTLFSQENHNRLLRSNGACSIDLSDASDHVSRRLVSLILPNWKSLLFSVRSTFARFPDKALVPLRTFAPMGSGVCFSVLTAVCVGICKFACKRPFHVYGDDVIVHVRDYDYVISLMTKAGLVVNTAKSCCTLFYRESCGVELFKQTDITPLYMRSNWTAVDGVHMEAILRRLDEEDAPFAYLRERLLQEWRERFGALAVRWNQQYQRLEVKVPVLEAHKATRPVSDYNGLNRWFSVKAEDQQVVFRVTNTRLRFAWRCAEDYPLLVRGLGIRDHLSHPAKDDQRPKLTPRR